MNTETQAAIDYLEEVITVRLSRADLMNVTIAVARAAQGEPDERGAFKATLTALYKGQVTA